MTPKASPRSARGSRCRCRSRVPRCVRWTQSVSLCSSAVAPSRSCSSSSVPMRSKYRVTSSFLSVFRAFGPLVDRWLLRVPHGAVGACGRRLRTGPGFADCVSSFDRRRSAVGVRGAGVGQADRLSRRCRAFHRQPFKSMMSTVKAAASRSCAARIAWCGDCKHAGERRLPTVLPAAARAVQQSVGAVLVLELVGGVAAFYDEFDASRRSGSKGALSAVPFGVLHVHAAELLGELDVEHLPDQREQGRRCSRRRVSALVCGHRCDDCCAGSAPRRFAGL